MSDATQTDSPTSPAMFCFQCEERSKGACTLKGVCGKTPEVAALLDLLVAELAELGAVAHTLAAQGHRDDDLDVFLMMGLFATVTNVNFDSDQLVAWTRQAAEWTASLRQTHTSIDLPAPRPTLSDSLGGLVSQGKGLQIPIRQARNGEDVVSLQELLLYGLKGTAAYAWHAHELGRHTDSLSPFMLKSLHALHTDLADADALTALCFECGKVNIDVMALLDAAHNDTFGAPEPTPVRMGPVAGKAILVSGHDLGALKALLEQTEGTGIQVYTHSEMLPAHGYPGLKSHTHLAGNIGGAWHQQQKDFSSFPGPIIMTTNCIQEPRPSYADRLYTTGAVGWPGVKHLDSWDFSDVIAQARALPGYETTPESASATTGFGHKAVLGLAGTVVDAVKSGDIKHFFLVGGCDGRKKERRYYSEFVADAPDDTVVLTLGCAKFRFIDLDLGDIGGIPRLLDVGQCNDAYSAVRIATALADAFNTDVNGLPLSLNISWYEQKATCILLSLLYLGVKDIHLGPTLPEYVSPGVLDVLVKNFGVRGISTPAEDMAGMLAK